MTKRQYTIYTSINSFLLSILYNLPSIIFLFFNVGLVIILDV